MPALSLLELLNGATGTESLRKFIDQAVPVVSGLVIDRTESGSFLDQARLADHVCNVGRVEELRHELSRSRDKGPLCCSGPRPRRLARA